MQSLLIICQDKEKGLDYVSSFALKNKIDRIDLDINLYEKTVGIPDIRVLQKKLFLKPIKSKTKAIVLEGYNGLTIEAQNALLKVLEEPPAHTIIYILIPNKDLLLPTILSRCKIVELKDESFELSQEENTQYLNILISLLELSVGERLKLAQDIVRNKGEASMWLEKMIIVARRILIENYYTGSNNYNRYNCFNILTSFQKTHTLLKTTNVSKRLALENLFLSL